MGLADLPRLATFLRRVSQEPQTTEGCPEVTVEPGLTSPGGTRYDRYDPRERPRGVVVTVHGETMAAEKDHRLGHFCRCLALSGLRCLAPRLPGLADLRFDATDLDALEDVVLLEDHPALVGFSFGASQGLVVAARPRMDLRFVLAFGAYHDLGPLLDQHLCRVAEPPDDEAWDDWAYARGILAWNVRDRLAVPEDDLGAFLAGWCHNPSMASKRAFVDRWLRDLPPMDQVRARLDPQVLTALSPAGRVRSIRCPVGLVYDLNDRLVPPREGRHIRAELQGVPCHHVETTLLSHVDLRKGMIPMELLGLVRVLARLLG